ncbi:hypothetical protein LCGC14_1950460 [marine sediment metagenome]|uniref:Uncharacterized protein n=1 Tax=marine sediment metagenome TaxID=412755 RepID=A0A0F9FHY9_9ZZZZ
MRRKQSLRRFIKQCVRYLHTKRIGQSLGSPELRYDFEKEILDVLVKYKLYNPLQSAPQHINIDLDVDEYPIIKLEVFLIDKPKEN